MKKTGRRDRLTNRAGRQEACAFIAMQKTHQKLSNNAIIMEGLRYERTAAKWDFTTVSRSGRMSSMRIFWYLFGTIVAFQKVIIPFYFFVLSAFTAPSDTSDLIQEINRLMGGVSGNLALDLVLLTLGSMGLIATLGWGNWRIALHRHLSKSRLERLVEDAKRISEDIANTISQERVERDRQMSVAWQSDQPIGGFYPNQDNRYLAKHMMEAYAVIERLRDVGYWRPHRRFDVEIGIAGASQFAAESICKALYAASERIKSDLKDGTISVLTQPPRPPSTEG